MAHKKGVGSSRNGRDSGPKYLGVKHVMLTSSGTTALTAALVGQRIGPGDEVLVPACTYIATAIAVVAAGAIPVIVDVDESLTMDPDAVEAEYNIPERHQKFLRAKRRLPYIRAGHRTCLYDRRDIEAFLDARRVEAIGQPSATVHPTPRAALRP